jgi:8-oxo-dGTP pyrophosphatase MutT (NUDIX family)
VEEVSAGGLVVDADRLVVAAVLIARRNRRGRLEWVLPKGHVEAGESTEAAAVREVCEETGITGRIVAPLGTIDYWFSANGLRIHKTVHHFLLRASGGELSDLDAEVEQVAWFPLDQASRRLTFADERQLVGRAPGLLAASA